MAEPTQTADVSTGECQVCHRQGITIIRATGLLWRHGPRANQCDGSNELPVQGSMRTVPSFSDQASSSAPTADDSLTDLLTSVRVHRSALPIQHPPLGVSVLKRLPKGARIAASSLLTRLIRDLLKDTECTKAWVRLLGFASSCFARPGRGGRSHNLTTLITRQIRDYEAGGGGRGGAEGEGNMYRTIDNISSDR